MVLSDNAAVYARHNKFGAYFSIAKRKNAVSDVTLVLKGKLNYVINGSSYAVNAGDGIFIPDGASCQRIAGKDYADFISLNFAGCADILPTGIIENAVNAQIKSAVSLFDANEDEKTEFYSERKNFITSLILSYVLSGASAEKESKTVRHIKKYVSDNIGEKITLKGVGESLYFSPVYADAVFKRETGVSIINYAILKKVEAAKSLLSEGVSLKDVSEAVGFSDYNYFSRLFKKRTGYTPNAFRKTLV